MPELPEVTALAESLTQRTAGAVVARVDVAAINALKTVDPPIGAVAGSVVLGWSRLGKHLIADLVDANGEPLHLVIHLSRAGWVRWRDEVPPAPAPFGRRGGGRGAGSALALRLVFSRPGQGTSDPAPPLGALDVTEAGTQKRLAVHVVADPSHVPRIAALGPEPLDPAFDASTFHAILTAAGRSQVKGVLRDQSRIAGVGNAYSDEVLHAAQLSPFTPAITIASDPAVEARLLAALRGVLDAALITARGTDPTSLKAEKRASMAVHARTGLPCPVCGDAVREVSFADSSLQYCATCQTGGRPLADRRMSRLLK